MYNISLYEIVTWWIHPVQWTYPNKKLMGKHSEPLAKADLWILCACMKLKLYVFINSLLRGYR
jgi:hypothetical protein